MTVAERRVDEPLRSWLRSEWYVVATRVELEAGPVGRTVLGERVVLFVGADGHVGALADECPHRIVPLSLGTVAPAGLQCGYHGFTFGRDGRCTLAPGNDRIPPNSDVRSYPVVEHHGWVFAWLGDGPPDAQHPHLQSFIAGFEPDYVWASGSLHIAADYQLVSDNLLDLSHLDYVHGQLVGGSTLAEHPVEVTVDGDVVRALRVSRDQPVFPFFAERLPPLIDNLSETRWHPPGNLTIVGDFYARDAGPGTGIRSLLQIATTPESKGTCHYFWQTGVQAAHADLLPIQDQATAIGFSQDVPVFEAQQGLLSGRDVEAERLAGSVHDHGLTRARTIMKRLRRAEAGGDVALAPETVALS